MFSVQGRLNNLLQVKILEMNLPGVIDDVLQGGNSGSWRLDCPYDPHFYTRTSLQPIFLSAPHGAGYQESGVRGGFTPLGDIVFWNGDKNCIHKAIRKPERRKSISELCGTENREFPSGGAWFGNQRSQG